MPAAIFGIIHSCDSQQSHIWKETVKAALLSVFRDLTNLLVKPKCIRHDLMVDAQYTQAPISTAKKCMDQPFALIAEQRGSYFPNLAAWHNSVFFSQG